MVTKLPACATAAAVFHAATVWSADYQVPKSVVATGGTEAVSTSYSLGATVGQPVTGAGASASYQGLHGYWYNLYATASAITDEPTVPRVTSLEQNYPNPFNPTTTIRFALSAGAMGSLRVFDVTGALVARLVEETLPAGVHDVVFDANHLASGVYFYRLDVPGFRQTRKLVILK